MVYLLVDDEGLILEGMEDTLKMLIQPSDEIYTADDPFKAIELAKLHPIDIAFFDVDMPGMNGLKLAEKIHETSPNTEIIFATGYAHYSLDAWKTVAKAFILKPVTKDDMLLALEKVWSSMEHSAKNGASGKKKAALEAKCFGTFEIFHDDVPVHFTRKKSKEMVAYLIDRKGAMISTGEIRLNLWEEDEDSDEKKGYVRVLANDIRKSMEAIGITDFLRNDMDCYSINNAILSCDYYDFLDGDEKAIRNFNDEYMIQYPWAELTMGSLMDMKDN